MLDSTVVLWICTKVLATFSGTQKYRCVRRLYFLHTTIDQNPKYSEALARRNEGHWWLDIGSAFGQDVRLPVLDGWPANRMLATGEGWIIVTAYGECLPADGRALTLL